MSVVYFGSITEAIAVLVRPFRFLVIQINGIDAQLGQRVKLARITNAIVIGILPQSELREDFIVAVNYAISVATVCIFIELSEREKAVWMRRYGLRGEVAKQLGAVIY